MPANLLISTFASRILSHCGFIKYHMPSDAPSLVAAKLILISPYYALQNKLRVFACNSGLKSLRLSYKHLRKFIQIAQKIEIF